MTGNRIATLILIFVAASLHADDLASITRADIILIGEEKGSIQTKGGVILDIKVVLVLKGDAVTDSVLSATLELSDRWSVGFGSMPQRNRGLWLLRKNGSGLVVMPTSKDYPPARNFSLALDYPAENSGPSTAETRSDANSLTVLERSLRFTQGREVGNQTAVKIFRELDPSLQTRFISELSLDALPCVRSVGVAARLLKKDFVAIDDVIESAKSFSECLASEYIDDAISDIRSNDPVLIKKIGTLSEMDRLAISTSATEALLRIHTRETIPFLIDRLGDERPWIRAAAMSGLLEYASAIPDPKISLAELRRIQYDLSSSARK